MKRNRFIGFVLTLAFALTSAGQVVFRNYTTADGLSDNTVMCGIRDNYGFLWLGTSNGLNCFDGLHSTVFWNMADETYSYENSIIVSLFENGDDIWFGGSFGVYIYHRTANSFSRFDVKTKYGVIISSTVQRILRTDNGLIWFCTLGQGVFVYNPETNELMQDSRHCAFVSDITVGKDGSVYLASLNGDLCVYRRDGSYVQTLHIPSYQYDKDRVCVEHLGNDVMVGCNTGLYLFRREENELSSIDTPLSMGAVRALLAKSEKEMLVGSEHGVYSILIGSNKISRLDNPESPIGSMADDVVNDMIWDKDSTLWIMTAMGGVSSVARSSQHVHFVPLPEGHRMGNRVRSICQSPNGDIWLGTNSGLYRYRLATHQAEQVKVDNTDYEINALMLDSTDLWIGTRHNGIRVLHTTSNKVTSYEYSSDRPYTLASNEINSIFRTSQGDIYVGTTWGLCRFDRKEERFMGFADVSSMTSFMDICEDAQGRLWAATSNRGIFLKDADSPYDDDSAADVRGTFKTYTSTSSSGSPIGNNVTLAFCDSRGVMWFAFNGGGLCYYDPASDSFIDYSSRSAILRDKNISFIEEDRRQNLWLGTTDGVVCIDITKDEVHSYNFSAPLFSGRLQRRASVNTASGALLFGVEGGLYHFRPEEMSEEDETNDVFIYSISFPNSTDNTAELQKNHLDRPLYATSNIRIPHRDNSFTLHFSAPCFGRPKPPVRYEYMLTGIDKTWARETTNPNATYANVPPGEYDFLLREAGRGQNEKTAKLHITILPPWYRTTLAIIAYILLAIGLMLLAVRMLVNHFKSRYNRRVEEYKAKQEKEDFQSKIHFFVNLVHEIRTPLTLISLPLEEMEEAELNATERNQVNTIRKNVDYLLGITNQLLDFQKADEGGVTLHLENENVNQLLKDLYIQFSGAAEVQGKALQLQLPDNAIVTSLDVDKIRKVVMNMMSNALKYARSEIILRLEQNDDKTLALSVIDDGPGVPDADKERIFDKFYQVAGDDVAAAVGTGLGLAYARMLATAHKGGLKVIDAVGGGSHFLLTLPITTAAEEVPSTVIRPADASTAEEPTSTYRILLVEDNDELVRMMANALKQWYRVLKARDGVEALDVLTHQEVDIIVSDVMMPRMDGVELCRCIRNDVNISHIPIILLTAKTSVDSKLEGMQSGADVYMEKPFSIKQLHLQISNLLRMRQKFYEQMKSLDGSRTELSAKELGMNVQDVHFMQRLQELIANNIQDSEYSIDNLADQLNMSRSSFYRKVKSLTDMTPADYMKKIRLDQAAALLREGCRIQEVAERMGFASSSYFAKCFRAQFGVLPKDYTEK